MSSIADSSLPASRRISFLPPNPDVAQWLFELHRDSRFTKHLCYTGWSSPSETASYLLKEIEYHHHFGYGQWLLKEYETGELIGMAGFQPPACKGLPELSYRLAPPHWGRGLGTEAVESLLEFGFTRLKFEGIEARVKRENSASIRILHRAGFEQITHGLEAIKLFKIMRNSYIS